jgi:hypothetical protein
VRPVFPYWCRGQPREMRNIYEIIDVKIVKEKKYDLENKKNT